MVSTDLQDRFLEYYSCSVPLAKYEWTFNAMKEALEESKMQLGNCGKLFEETEAISGRNIKRLRDIAHSALVLVASHFASP